jgi:hypothetical protein
VLSDGGHQVVGFDRQAAGVEAEDLDRQPDLTIRSVSTMSSAPRLLAKAAGDEVAGDVGEQRPGRQGPGCDAGRQFRGDVEEAGCHRFRRAGGNAVAAGLVEVW